MYVFHFFPNWLYNNLFEFLFSRIFFPIQGTINLLDYTDDEHLIITEMSTQELIDAKAFCHTGINDRANPNVLKALGNDYNLP